MLLAVDGVVHPAAYERRNIRTNDAGDGKFMTITVLHLLCIGSAPLAGGISGVPVPSDYTADIVRVFPQLVPWLKK